MECCQDKGIRQWRNRQEDGMGFCGNPGIQLNARTCHLRREEWGAEQFTERKSTRYVQSGWGGNIESSTASQETLAHTPFSRGIRVTLLQVYKDLP